MKKLLLLVICVFAFVGTAHAMTTLFTFEDVGSTANLGTYMTNLFGQTVNPGDASWRDNSDLFGSDVIRTEGSTSELDFDTASAGASLFEITSLSFRWGVYDSTTGYDFGLNVYNDATGNWIDNVFTRSGVSDDTTGLSGDIVFDSTWQITRIAFHDSDDHDVGLDNLNIVDNRPDAPVGGDPVPEPASMMLLGMGILGLVGLKRKKA